MTLSGTASQTTGNRESAETRARGQARGTASARYSSPRSASTVKKGMIIRLAATIVAVGSFGRTIGAQSQPPTQVAQKQAVPAAFCIRGQPIQRCRSFAIIELPIGARVAHTLRSDNSGVADAYAGLELGGMVNRSETHAIGGTVSAAYSGGDSHFSVSARSRTWFSGDPTATRRSASWRPARTEGERHTASPASWALDTQTSSVFGLAPMWGSSDHIRAHRSRRADGWVRTQR